MLRMFARLRGIPNGMIEDVVTNVIEQLNLGKWADKLCGTYRYLVSCSNRKNKWLKCCMHKAFIQRPNVLNHAESIELLFCVQFVAKILI